MPPIGNPRIGATIRERRKVLGLSLQALADSAEINKGTLSRIENDEMVPGTNILVALGSALGTPIGELVGETTQSPLPELHVYLRAKYDLPEDAIARIARQLQAEYGGEPGPRDGEDEVDHTNN